MFNKESLLEAARQRLAKKEDVQKERDDRINELFEKEVGEFFERKKTALLNESLPAVFTPLITETRNTIEQREGLQLDENWRYYLYISEGGKNKRDKVYDPGYGYPKKHYQYGSGHSRDVLYQAWVFGNLGKKVKMGITIELTKYDYSKLEGIFVSFDYDETSGHIVFVAGSPYDGIKSAQREWDGKAKTFNEFTENLTTALDERNYAYFFMAESGSKKFVHSI
ncbi:MAG: hypothetical protein NTZ93_04160 [Candidatus Beckwithbacteria bacterium]|nr:hypothetical protein [Candidatus Beckwithbacteria bacterium]